MPRIAAMPSTIHPSRTRSKDDPSMNKHDHAGHKHPHSGHAKKPIHHDWRAWVVVGLMLLGMVVYVLSLDESLVPGGPAAAPSGEATATGSM